jgi:phosphoglycolate phosphatase
MRYSLVIFDLDGTLADSFPWFLRNVNGVADRFGFRRVADGDVAALRRAGVDEIFARLEVPRWKLPLIVRHMRKLKAAHMASIALFPGVDPMLRTLADAGVRLALVSSDNEANAAASLADAAIRAASNDAPIPNRTDPIQDCLRWQRTSRSVCCPAPGKRQSRSPRCPPR